MDAGMDMVKDMGRGMTVDMGIDHSHISLEFPK